MARAYPLLGAVENGCYGMFIGEVHADDTYLEWLTLNWWQLAPHIDVLLMEDFDAPVVLSRRAHPNRSEAEWRNLVHEQVNDAVGPSPPTVNTRWKYYRFVETVLGSGKDLAGVDIDDRPADGRLG